MGLRERSNGKAVTGTYIAHASGDVYTRSTNVEHHWIRDYTGPGDCNDLDIEHRSLRGGLVSGNNSWGQWIGFPPDGLTNVGIWSHNGIATPSNGEYAAKLVARTSPSRPSVDLPVSIAELRELPSLVRDSGNFRYSKLARHLARKGLGGGLRRASQLNLMIQFGIMPLISDAQKLLIFQKLVDSRLKELKRLKQRGVRRTIELDRFSNAWQGNLVLQSSYATVGCLLSKVTTLVVRGHVRYSPNFAPETWTDSQMRLQALRAVLGATLDFKTAWELMPWSWLIDWFSSAGDLLASTRNIIPVTRDKVVIMRETTTQSRSLNKWASTGLSVEDLSCDCTWKVRRTANPSLNAHMPVLTNRQLSILGSLSVLKT